MGGSGHRLLAVESMEPNLRLLSRILASNGFACDTALGIAAFDDALASSVTFDLALVDATGLDASVGEHGQRLHDRAVPLLVVSPRQSAVPQRQSFAHGAQSVLVKPLVARNLMELIRTLLTT